MTTNTYAADRTALLIVDPYNDFISKGGKLYEALRETAEAADALRYLVEGLPLRQSHPHNVTGFDKRRQLSERCFQD